MKRYRTRFWRMLAALLIAVSLLLGYHRIISQKPVCTMYTVETDISEPLRVAHLTDLHNREFGSNNEELVALITAQKPDMIFLTGDMLNREDEDIEIVLSLVGRLTAIAPVYYGYGNHETAWEQMHGNLLQESLTAAGAVVLNNNYVDVKIKEQDLRIGGYMGYYRQPHMMTQDEKQKSLEYAFFDDFEKTDRLKLLLNHIPTGWTDWGYLDKFPVDIIFSGHYHGGLIRLPVWERGLYAPYIGFFPPHTRGMYTGEKATCILSAGLGSEHIIPRINNPPEVVVVDLIAAEK